MFCAAQDRSINGIETVGTNYEKVRAYRLTTSELSTVELVVLAPALVWRDAIFGRDCGRMSLTFAFHSPTIASWLSHADSGKCTTLSQGSWRSINTLRHSRKSGKVWS